MTVSKENARENTKETAQKASFDFLSLILILVIVAVAVVSVNCYIRSYEKNYEGEVLASQLREVNNESDRLMIEYQRRINYLNVERYAKDNLSMKKINRYQIEYIDRDVTNTVEVVPGGDDREGTFAEDLAKAFSVILEYFR